MKSSKYSAASIATLLREQKIATMPELITVLGATAKRTVFRKLKELPYRTSYSHRGRYYTLDDVAEYDELGLWAYNNVWFSIHGTLLLTATAMVENSEVGYFVEELDNLLHVGTKDALLKLFRETRLMREEVAGRFLYCAANMNQKHQQVLARRALLTKPGVVGPIPEELRASIVLFFSLLDEKQRRLYAGLEAMKTGRGGDACIAELLNLDIGTVARGRRELLTQDIEVERVRKTGAGRKPLEKKHQK